MNDIVVDTRRLPVLQAYRHACRREGIRGDGLVAIALAHWCCHREDFLSDLPFEPATWRSEREARARVCAAVFAAERRSGGELPTFARARLTIWATATWKRR